LTAKGKPDEQLRLEGPKIDMAGDGVTDAPTLAAADVGIAMGTGADVAMERTATGRHRQQGPDDADEISACLQSTPEQSLKTLPSGVPTLGPSQRPPSASCSRSLKTHGK